MSMNHSSKPNDKAFLGLSVVLGLARVGKVSTEEWQTFYFFVLVSPEMVRTGFFPLVLEYILMVLWKAPLTLLV